MRIITSIAVVLLVGCSSGGGDSSPLPNNPPPAPPSESPNGIWEGTFAQGGNIIVDANDAEIIVNINCLIPDGEQIVCLVSNSLTGVLVGSATGTISVSGSDVSGVGMAYTLPGYSLNDGSASGPFSVTEGTVAERTSLDLVVSVGGTTGSVSATFDAAYDRGSDLGTVSGAYTLFAMNGGPASFSIDSNGVLFAQGEDGCVGNGQVELIDPDFNGYGVEMTISSCPGIDGVYSGLAITIDENATDDALLFGVFNSTGGLVGAPVK